MNKKPEKKSDNLKRVEALENETEIKTEPAEKKETRGRKPGTGSGAKLKMNKAEIAKYLFLIFNFICVILNKQNPYMVEDFYAEAEALQRLSEKFSVINTILNLLNPIIIISGFIEKFAKLKEAPKK